MTEINQKDKEKGLPLAKSDNFSIKVSNRLQSTEMHRNSQVQTDKWNQMNI